ncbi:MAG TPA: GntP family permease [Planctomycetota bacterium]|nr:GntP family permease [Planctomycetota bacterium]
MAVFAIVLSLCLLMYLAYRGITVLLLAPILALMAVALGGDLPLLATYTEVFMKSFGSFAKSFFPLFLLGAVFGRIMADSGSAKAISLAITRWLGAKHAILAIVAACAALTYGGVSLFVVAFAVYPIAVQLFRDADIPKRLIPGALALGSFTFTMTALPGTPQIQNSIPMPYFGTDTFAAPTIGIIASLMMAGLGYGWLSWRARNARRNSEGFGTHTESAKADETVTACPLVLALLPIVIVIGLNYYLTRVYYPAADTAYLASEPYKTSVEKVSGLWSLIIALTAAIIVAFAIHFRRLRTPINSLNEGAYGSLLAIVNTASEVGYGSVIASLSGFTIIKNGILQLSSNPLVAESISITTLAGITGSASGGLSIALGALGPTYLEMAQVANISPEVMHRIACIACGGLDSLPHNGAVITLLAICGLTHKQSYLDIGMTTVVIPLLTLAVSIALAMAGVV